MDSILDIPILKNLKLFRKIFQKKIFTSLIYIDSEKKYFIKKIINYLDYQIFDREIFFLKLLNQLNFDWAPKLVYYNNNIIITEYIGEEINYLNIPPDYKIQINKILLDLKNNNIRHNDIVKYTHCELVLGKNNKIYLVDFGWSTLNGDYSCGINLDKREKPFKNFEDEAIIPYLDNLFMDKKIYCLKIQNPDYFGSKNHNPVLLINNNKLNINNLFELNNNNINYFQKKFDLIKKILINLKFDSQNLLNINPNSGIILYLAYYLKYNKIYGLEPDPGYYYLLDNINGYLKIPNIFIKKNISDFNIKNFDIIIYFFPDLELIKNFQAKYYILEIYNSQENLVETLGGSVLSIYKIRAESNLYLIKKI